MINDFCYKATLPLPLSFRFNSDLSFMRTAILLSLLLSLTRISFSQSDPFSIELEPVTIADLPGIQAYAWGQHDDLWLIIGGRIDGLHRRQPFASFSADQRNTNITVIDPHAGKVWSAPLTSLPIPLQDQLSSTNMEFHQSGNTLYLIGGYGHSATIDSKLTYAMLTAVDVPGMIHAVQQEASLSPYVRSITDTRFAVTGGHLGKIDDTWYLLGGQKFDGNYNPMNHPTFVQEYTNGIRKFNLHDDGKQLVVSDYTAWSDTSLFHRRDYNAGPQILQDGSMGLMSFAGPFQVGADIPYLNVASVEKNEYHQVPGFAQYYNQYHCAHLPLYDANKKEMHTVFFGGIAQYYPEEDLLVSDSDVPFVKTISRVTRNAKGQYAEYRLPNVMPGYLGASAEFIPLSDLPQHENGVIRLDALPNGRSLTGYIYGGIESTDKNIFWTTEGEASTAQNVVYKVYVVKGGDQPSHQLNPQSKNGWQLQILPINAEEAFHIHFQVEHPQPAKLVIANARGKVLSELDLSGKIQSGDNRIQQTINPYKIGEAYLVTLQIGEVTATQKVLIKP